MVKRLRYRPLTAKSGVRFPLGLPMDFKSLFLALLKIGVFLFYRTMSEWGDEFFCARLINILHSFVEYSQFYKLGVIEVLHCL